MTGRASTRTKAREAAADGSRSSALFRGGKVGLIVAVAGLVAAVLMVVAELSTYREIETITATCEDLASAELADECRTSGGEQHGYALLLVAVVALVMAWGAGPGRSRPAAAALAFLGLVVLGIALLGDLPDVDAAGAVSRNFTEAEGVAGPTIPLEISGAVLLLGAGALRLVAERRRG